MSCHSGRKIPKNGIKQTKLMKLAFCAISFLAGCGLMPTDEAPEASSDGARSYSIMSLYDGEVGSKELAAQGLDIDARNLCRADYMLLSEEIRPIMNRIGEVTSSRLVWEIKCLPQAGSTPPR